VDKLRSKDPNAFQRYVLCAFPVL